MEQKKFDDYGSLCKYIAGEICDHVYYKPSLLLCIAAGHTSLGVFEELIKAVHEDRVDFSSAYFIAMDEWLGMNENTPGSCGEFLRKNFLNHVNFPVKHVRLFNGTACDPGSECRNVEEFISAHSNGIDYLVLGVGMNGHLALNEPGISFSTRAHVTKLDDVTRKTGQKYFTGPVKLTDGLTLGIDNFREAKRSVLMVSGNHKKDILRRTIEEEISPRFPATAIRNFANGALFWC
jgi:glucosamine-6-phosphate isomerase